MEVLLYYGEDFGTPSSLGVPYQDFVSTDAEPARLTTGETIAKINDDIDLALSLFNDSNDDDVFRVNPDYALFLRTRLALYSGDWSSVITQSNTLITDYPLADQSQYQAMFAGDLDQTEVIFSYDNVQGGNFNNIASEFRFGGGGNFISMSNELYNILATEQANNNDIRLSVNFDPASDLTIINQKGINKFPIGGGAINDFKTARTSEVYLMRAEAFARQSQFQNAADALWAVRNARRGAAETPSAYTSLIDAITDIKFERRLELCYEGHRYLDINRFRNILNEGMTRDADDCPGSIPCNISVNDRKWTFPIPLQELNGNPNMVQNEEW
jgi:hypothetical protein